MASEILCALADYPVYDESHFSEMEWNEAIDYWQSMSLCDRMELAKDAGLSVFAARHDYIPYDDTGYIFEHLTN